MPLEKINGIDLNYREHGAGPLAVLVMGTGSPGKVWETHQVPALVGAGYRVVTFDNRGIAPSSECGGDFTIGDMVADVAALIEHVGGGPALVIGTSLGARITQELALARPDLVRAAVAMAAFARPDPVQDAHTEGLIELHDAGIVLPPLFHAAVTAMQNLSPATLADPAVARDWLDVFALTGAQETDGIRGQHRVQVEGFTDRRSAYRAITVPLLVIGFGDDLRIPPAMCREVADAVPGARYEEIPGCGHFGYLERPEEVNAVLLAFLDEHRGGTR